MADDDDAYLRDDPDEIDELREEWKAVFDDPMPWGFKITEDQLPLLRQCIAERSKAPLQAYIASIPKNRIY